MKAFQQQKVENKAIVFCISSSMQGLLIAVANDRSKHHKIKVKFDSII